MLTHDNKADLSALKVGERSWALYTAEILDGTQVPVLQPAKYKATSHASKCCLYTQTFIRLQLVGRQLL